MTEWLEQINKTQTILSSEDIWLLQIETKQRQLRAATSSEGVETSERTSQLNLLKQLEDLQLWSHFDKLTY